MHQTLINLVESHEEYLAKISDLEDSLIEKQDDLESLHEEFADAVMGEAESIINKIKHCEQWINYDKSDLRQAKKFAGEAADLLHYMEQHTNDYEQVGSWRLPIDFIHDDDFEDYVQELVRDIHGEIESWIVIDWESTASNIKYDYTLITIEGEDYWFR